MERQGYLPSLHFTIIVLSIALAGGLVVGAEYYTRPQAPAQLSIDTSAPQDDPNWQATLDQIQAQSGTSLPTAPDQGTVQSLLAAAQSSNVTDSIGKSILINLTNAQYQGMGDDIPTQDQLVAAAAAQIQQSQATTSTYSASDLTIVPVSPTTLHAYGNNVMTALNTSPAASEKATFIAIDMIVEGHDASQAKQLATIGAAYQAAAAALLAVPVPQTLAPLQLEAINNLMKTAATFSDMEAIGQDPVRGLEGFQTYEASMDEGARVFTNIAQELSKDGILFTKDEPGSAWSVFVNSS